MALVSSFSIQITLGFRPSHAPPHAPPGLKASIFILVPLPVTLSPLSSPQLTPFLSTQPSHCQSAPVAHELRLDAHHSL